MQVERGFRHIDQKPLFSSRTQLHSKHALEYEQARDKRWGSKTNIVLGLGFISISLTVLPLMPPFTLGVAKCKTMSSLYLILL